MKKLAFPPEILEGLKQALTLEKKHIESQIADVSKQDPFADEDRLTDNAASDTEAKEEFDHDRVQAMLEELKQERADVDAALERIEKGTYGFCLNCGNLIDTDRLNILPTATLCAECAAKQKK